MDHELFVAMVGSGRQACQGLLPNDLSSLRLDIVRLPVVNLTDRSFLDSVFQPLRQPGGLQLYHATESNAG
jgi:hypothetical protein